MSDTLSVLLYCGLHFSKHSLWEWWSVDQPGHLARARDLSEKPAMCYCLTQTLCAQIELLEKAEATDNLVYRLSLVIRPSQDSLS